VLRAPDGGIEEIGEEADGILSEYTEPEDEKKKTAMKNEAMIKRAITRRNDVFGKVKLFRPVPVADVSESLTLADVVRRVLSSTQDIDTYE
jgi:hypothetical protein